MATYNVGDTFNAASYVDAYFRNMPTGTVLSVRRQVQMESGLAQMSSGIYEKASKGYFVLTHGQMMFVDENAESVNAQDPPTPETPRGGQTVYPDEMLFCPHLNELEFRVQSVGSSKE